MAKLENGHLSGHIGQLIYQYQRGIQTTRSMPSSYRDKKSDEQLEQRAKMQAAMQLYRHAKTVIEGCFEPERPGQRLYDCFLHHNLLSLNTIAHGSLEPLAPTLHGNQLQVVLDPSDWQEGDTLRFIAISESETRHEDIPYHTLSDDTTCRTLTQPGLYAFVHLRQEDKKPLASTQSLVQYLPTEADQPDAN